MSGTVFTVFLINNIHNFWVTLIAACSLISKVKVTQSCLTLCDLTDCSLLGSSVHGILQARILEWVTIPSPGDLSNPGIEPRSPTLQEDSLPSESPGKPYVKVPQLCLTLCDPMDYTVHEILQARVLEWVAFPFSTGSSQPRDWTQVSWMQADSLPAEPQGKPYSILDLA